METFWLNELNDGTGAIYPGMSVDEEVNLSAV